MTGWELLLPPAQLHTAEQTCHAVASANGADSTNFPTLQALGCLLYYLLFSKLAFNPDAKLQILNGEFTVAGNRPPAMVALLRELLVVPPARRPG